MFLNYIHNLRAVAILFVVLGHSVSIFSTDSIIDNIIRFVTFNSTVLFVVLAGYMFAFLFEKYTYKTYLISKLKYVILPYLIVSIPAIILYVAKLKTTHVWVDLEWLSNNVNVFQQCCYFLLTGAHLGPLWFIPMIIIYYLFFPLFEWLLKSKCQFYFLLLSTIIALFIGRPENNNNIILLSFYFLPSYLLGMFLFSNKKIYRDIETPFIKMLLLLSVMITTYFIFGYYSSIDLIYKLILSILMFSLFYTRVNKQISVFSHLADISFFIFFVHGYFIGAIRMLNNKYAFEYFDFFSIILSFIVVMSLTALIANILVKTFGKYGRVLFGLR